VAFATLLLLLGRAREQRCEEGIGFGVAVVVVVVMAVGVGVAVGSQRGSCCR
jgi:hypothetical protein